MNRVKESTTPLLLTDNIVLAKKKNTEQKKNICRADNSQVWAGERRPARAHLWCPCLISGPKSAGSPS